MNAATSPNLLERIMAEGSALAAPQQQSLLDYARFLRQQSAEPSPSWDALLDDEAKAAKFASWAAEAMAEGEEQPMDFKLKAFRLPSRSRPARRGISSIKIPIIPA